MILFFSSSFLLCGKLQFILFYSQLTLVLSSYSFSACCNISSSVLVFFFESKFLSLPCSMALLTYVLKQCLLLLYLIQPVQFLMLFQWCYFLAEMWISKNFIFKGPYTHYFKSFKRINDGLDDFSSIFVLNRAIFS